ncbi:MAG TPA: helix-turn-helix transcriptional regulator [Pseudolysinimonas sp.]|jgi:transcriptional regulator with XRE-family HTH domain
MLLRHAIGAALRRIRLDDGLTLREVALAASISMPYLSEIERGRKEPSSEILAGICRALGLSLVDLLQETSAEAFVLDLTAPVAPVTAITSTHDVRELIPLPTHRTATTPRTETPRAEIGLVAA